MNKEEFLYALRDSLTGLPEEDIEKSVDYYSENIDDHMDEGLTEEEAVKALGSIEEIASEILMEMSLPKVLKVSVKPKRTLKAWEIVLLVLGSPVWLPLLACAAVIVLTVYVVIWSVIVSLYSVDISFAACAVAGIVGSVVFMIMGNITQGFLAFGSGLVCTGFAILLFFAFNQISKAMILLSKKFLCSIKAYFIKRRDA